MKRRSFLGLVLIAPFAGPTMVRVAVSAPASLVAPPLWVATGWWEKEFNYRSMIGYCIQATNRLTGETRRNACRTARGRPIKNAQWAIDARGRAKRILTGWVDDLNADRSPRLGPGVVGDWRATRLAYDAAPPSSAGAASPRAVGDFGGQQCVACQVKPRSQGPGRNSVQIARTRPTTWG